MIAKSAKHRFPLANGSNYAKLVGRSAIHIKLLLTGVAGFICSHLADKYVNEGHTVIGIDNLHTGNLSNIRQLQSKYNFKFVYGDIRNKELINRLMIGVDVVIHTAAIIHVDKSMYEPELTFDVNLNGTLVLLEAARLNNVKKFIYASTSEVYGEAQEFPMTESHPLDSPHNYGVSKLAADRLCYSYFRTYGMPISICRNFNVFGERQKDNGYGAVIGIFTKRALQGLPLPVYGDGSQTRDYMYVEDAVQAYDLLVRKDFFGLPVNFGTSRNLSIKDIAYKIIGECGSNSKVVFAEPRPNEVKDLVADIRRAKKLLGFKPKYTFEEGLKLYVEWFRKYRTEEWKIT